MVDDEINIRKSLAIGLEADGHAVQAVSNAADAVAEAARQPFDLAFVDLRLGLTSGLDLVPDLLAQSPWTRVVIITAHGSIDSAVETMRRGASDYLTKPFTPAQVRLVVERAAKLRGLEQRVAALEGAASATEVGGEDDLLQLTSSPPMQRAVALARRAAETDVTVLVRGESGTGKGVLARAVHGWSPRAASPFATVSCPTLSAQLLESELFGHAKGAFTGAVRDNPGRIAACDGGDAVPGRDRRPAAGVAAEAAAVRAGPRVRAGRREPDPAGRRAAGDGHQRRPGGGRAGRAIP